MLAAWRWWWRRTACSTRWTDNQRAAKNCTSSLAEQQNLMAVGCRGGAPPDLRPGLRQLFHRLLRRDLLIRGLQLPGQHCLRLGLGLQRLGRPVSAGGTGSSRTQNKKRLKMKKRVKTKKMKKMMKKQSEKVPRGLRVFLDGPHFDRTRMHRSKCGDGRRVRSHSDRAKESCTDAAAFFRPASAASSSCRSLFSRCAASPAIATAFVSVQKQRQSRNQHRQ